MGTRRSAAGRGAAPALVLSCEHGGNRIPSRYAAHFRAHHGALAAHHGFDAGALDLARAVARATRAPLFASTVSRLLVDLNRSLHHRRVLSEVSRGLPRAERERIIAHYYLPYRRRVHDAIARHVRAGRRVVHLSIHSFTPALNGRQRNADVGLLYDPSRRFERGVAAVLQQALRQGAPTLRVRRNYPYRGIADGHTSALRAAFADPRYAGIEIEVNQAVTLGPPRVRRDLRRVMADAVDAVILSRP